MLRRKTETDWLEEAEPVDNQSVNQMVLGEVHRLLGARISGSKPVRITEIGCGLGANRRRISETLSCPQHWVMTEGNPEVAELFRRRFRIDTDTSTDFHLLDEARLKDIGALVSGADLLILSGRAQPLTAEHLQALLKAAKGEGVAIWAVLQPTGFVKFEPESDDDQRVHQLAARPEEETAPALITRMEEEGFRVLKGESDWVVRGEDDSFWHSKGRGLQRTFMQRYLASARRNHPDQALGLLNWANKRSVLIERKKTALTIGHVDILAIPEG